MVAGLAQAGAELRGDEHPVADNDRRRHAESTDRRLPCHVLSGAPFHRQTGLRRRACAAWPAPLRPVSRRERTTHDVNQDDCESYTT